METPFKDLAKSYSRIEDLSKRLEMIDGLIDLFRNRSPEDLEMIIRLSKGEVRPGYEGLELGVAEKLAVKALYQVTLIDMNEIEKKRKTIGDIGLLAQEIVAKKKQMSLFNEPLTLERVFGNLERIARSEGRSSQDLKLKIIAEMLHDASPLEARYITRIVCGKMRLGIADMTLIDALSYSFTDGLEKMVDELKGLDGSTILEGMIDEISTRRTSPLYSILELVSRPKKNDIDPILSEKASSIITIYKEKVAREREAIVRAYNIYPDLGSISCRIAKEGIASIRGISVTPSVPLRSMLGERLTSMKDILDKLGGRAALEYKYDGLRIQAHLFKENGKRRINLFSRQLENVTEQFPDIIEALDSSFDGEEAIVEGECVPIEADTGELLPFQLVSRRRGRKTDIDEKIEEVPVQLILFDCLFSNGRDMTTVPYLDRREEISKVFPSISGSVTSGSRISLSKMIIADNEKDGEDFFMRSLDDGGEGIMAKSISEDSFYQAGSRGWNWIKYKKDYRTELSDTLDLVVVGAFHGSGRRKGTYGALLMAVYSPGEGRFKTICKLGSGLNDKDLEDLVGKLDLIKGERNIVWKNVESKIVPDIHVSPTMVMEVLGAEITFSPVHTCSFGKKRDGAGFALRFPRFTGRFRDDKDPYDATTEKEIESMYELQVKLVSN